jgi:hypothetical protein
MERELLREAFVKLFPGNQINPFGQLGRRVIGVYDGNGGVQWNAGAELVDGEWTNPFFGVNLEGLAYNGGRPLYRLIKRERNGSQIHEAILKLQQPHMIQVSLVRDAWRGPKAPRGRPLHYTEREIIRIMADELNEEAWHQALEQSLDCFDSSDQPIWRQITFYDRRTRQPKRTSDVVYEMTPHLHFRSPLQLHAPTTWEALVERMWTSRNYGKALGEIWPQGQDALVVAVLTAHDRMQPLYDFVHEYSS